MSLAKVAELFEPFKFAYDHDNLEKANTLLPKLKIEMTKFSFLLPGNNDSEEVKNGMLLARNILETATLLSAKMNNFEAFERNITQLKPYYQSASFSNLQESPMQYTILGLNLLRLLANNQIADFHTELELIPTEMLDNTYIKHPIQLEQYLMEGSYTKIIETRDNVPSPTYTHFMDDLVETVRNEIASCSEKAYPSLPVDQACKLFMFNSDQLKEFAEDRDWKINGNKIIFEIDTTEDEKEQIPATKVIGRTLLYARELERIV